MELGGKYLIIGLVLVVIVGVYVGYTMTMQANYGETSCSVTDYEDSDPLDEIKESWIEPSDEDIENGVGIDEPSEGWETIEKNLVEPGGGNDDLEGVETEVHQETEVLPAQNSDDVEKSLIFFWANGCSICKSEKDFLEEMEHKYPELNTTWYEVSDNEGNAELMKEACKEYNLSCGRVPVTIVGNTAFESFKINYGDFIKYNDGGYVGYSNLIEDTIIDVLDLMEPDLGEEVKVDDLKEHLSFDAYPEKDLYYEGETMWVFCTITSDIAVSGLKVEIEGIDGRFNGKKDLDASIGENRVVFDENAPNCFNCANFQPGKYDVEVTLKKNKDIIDTNEFTIEIKEK